jgi:mono/diheme cytochrome c family protein
VLYPFAGLNAVFVIALVLILQGTLRPWADSSYSSESHFNFFEAREDYNRSPLSYLVGPTPVMDDWNASELALQHEDVDYALYVAYACAACHGYEGEGVPSGPPVAGAGERRSTNLTREGPGNMPAYSEDYLPPDRMDAINSYIGRFPEIPTPTPAPVPPTATPWPSPTPFPTPTPTVVPTPIPGAPTPTPTVVPTEVPEPTATPPPDPDRLAAGKASYVDWGCDLCHGVGGEGADDGPTVLGLSATELWDLTRVPVREANSKYPKEMKKYPESKISDEELADIVYYMLHLPPP